MLSKNGREGNIPGRMNEKFIPRIVVCHFVSYLGGDARNTIISTRSEHPSIFSESEYFLRSIQDKAILFNLRFVDRLFHEYSIKKKRSTKIRNAYRS